MYHGIVVNVAFDNLIFIEGFKVFAKKQSLTSSWILYGIEVIDQDPDKAVSDIQENMISDELYYAHLYNDNELIVIFKERVFRIKPHISTWKPIIEYGKTLNIPVEQLDFWPNRFQDERHYFDN